MWYVIYIYWSYMHIDFIIFLRSVNSRWVVRVGVLGVLFKTLMNKQEPQKKVTPRCSLNNPDDLPTWKSSKNQRNVGNYLSFMDTKTHFPSMVSCIWATFPSPGASGNHWQKNLIPWWNPVHRKKPSPQKIEHPRNQEMHRVSICIFDQIRRFHKN